MKLKMVCCVSIIVLTACLARGGLAGPFSVSGQLLHDGDKLVVSVTYTIPDKHHLYADTMTISAEDGVGLVELSAPLPEDKYDQFSDSRRAVYDRSFVAKYRVEPADLNSVNLKIGYQGCSEEFCFFPATTNLFAGTGREGDAVQGAIVAATSGPVTGTGGDWRIHADGFEVIGRRGGYIGSKAFLDFIGDAEAGRGTGKDWLQAMIDRGGSAVVLAVLAIVLFGLGLNLTPCVLPMIPINIAIIGAGAAAGSRARGAWLGGAYGCAIATVYGVLGVAVVVTGSKFGALNASPIFNAVIALVFVMLALAMFDVFSIDLSRFQNRTGSGGRRGSFAVAFIMGGVAALLAGACVAPVVISVLLLSTNLYVAGTRTALLLPFLLGVGMGLPWPFLGAGLSFLPKPGRWMSRVKAGFGILILGFALYYGYLSYHLFAADAHISGQSDRVAVVGGSRDGWMESLPAALARAQSENKPVFIDFWASWCKNCAAMDRTTFRDSAVLGRLEGYVRVKVQAEDPNAPVVREMLDYFGVIGLPTYVVLASDK